MSQSVKLRVVIDTNVWINVFVHKFLKSPKQPYTEIASALTAGEFVPVYCEECFDELVYMLTDSELAKHYGIDPVKGGEFVGIVLAKGGEQVEITGNVFLSSDPDDDAFAETALVGQVDILVSDDKDLHEVAVTTELGKSDIRVLWSSQFRAVLKRRRMEPEKAAEHTQNTTPIAEAAPNM